ncbi:MAG TPA: aromatic ring-hydroxylating dioxygenase subunit alpha [Sphingobium sp.]|nr:aromatic ring-hydroxylating dioxygenase subunit alpha [Sphingobium sp.]
MEKAYLERGWYFAGWSDELAAGTIKDTGLAGRSIAVYRTESGSIQAIGNRCPHRFVPLHLGRVQGDAAECGYHGLRFNGRGACVFSPHHGGAVPGALKVPSYAAVERDGIIWIWLSDNSSPDLHLIPDFSDLASSPETAVVHVPPMYVGADYELIVDNLLDPTHADFVHRDTLSNGESSDFPGKVEVRPRSLLADWSYDGAITMPFLSDLLPAGMAADTWTSVQWYPPGIIRFEAGIKPAGKARSEGKWTVSYHFLMPVAANLTRYDVRTTRSYDCDNVALTEAITAVACKAFIEEDKPMIEAQGKEIGDRDFWDMAPALLPSDGPAVRARRMLRSMIEAEAKELASV